jgi:hypothetical protein
MKASDRRHKHYRRGSKSKASSRKAGARSQERIERLMQYVRFGYIQCLAALFLYQTPYPPSCHPHVTLLCSPDAQEQKLLDQSCLLQGLFSSCCCKGLVAGHEPALSQWLVLSQAASGTPSLLNPSHLRLDRKPEQGLVLQSPGKPLNQGPSAPLANLSVPAAISATTPVHAVEQTQVAQGRWPWGSKISVRSEGW